MLKSGIYDLVICRGGTDMCFVLGFGRQRPDPKQHRISGLTTWYQSLTDRRGPSLVEVESRYKLFCSYSDSYRRVGIFLLLTLALVRTSAVIVLLSPYPHQILGSRVSRVSEPLQCLVCSVLSRFRSQVWGIL